MNAHALQRDSTLTSLRWTPEKKPSVDDIYPRLFDAILEQRIAPASRFTEEGLGELFGVSRSVIRRVLSKWSSCAPTSAPRSPRRMPSTHGRFWKHGA